MSDTDRPADDTEGPVTGPQRESEAATDTPPIDDTEATFADAFTPDDDGAPSAEDYESLTRTMSLDDNESDDDTDDGEVRHNAAPDEEPEPTSQREARYRTRLRDTEARLQAAANQNAALLDQLEAMQRNEATRLASTKLADPAGDLFREHGLDAVLDDDGTVDAERVNALADSIIASHPHYAIQKRSINPNAELRSGARKTAETPVSNWRQAFAPPVSE